MHEVRECAGHIDTGTKELYSMHKEEYGEMAARCIHIRLTERKGRGDCLASG